MLYRGSRVTARGALATLAVVVLTAGCAGERASEGATGITTFNRDVAPLLFKHCSSCHRPAGAAPFALLTYADARKRVRQIARVTRSRFMPPWLPEPGHGEFAGARRMTDDEIAVFRDWSRGNAIEGAASDLPPAPDWPDGWQLGVPDLVVEMPRPYTLYAEGIDVYRNFVIPAPVTGERWIRAVEFRPGNPKIVHHARLFVDRSGTSRQIDARDPLPGYEGMELGGAETPEGVLIGWAPGRVAYAGLPGMAWRLDANTDIVLQLHLLPSGRPERIHASIGLYFADEPPVLHPYAFVLGSRDIDIAAGQAGFVVEDSYELPVDVELLAVYPHAHYLGQTMRLDATLPDGTSLPLLRIDDWDLNWQDEYHYASPVPLPRGTTLAMRYTYDNSSDNPRNPHDPPQRVTYGARTIDEMAELVLQVLPPNAEQRAVLERDYVDKLKLEAIAYRLRRLAADPEDVPSLAALGSTYLSLELADEAVGPLREAVQLRPSDARLHNNLGYALQRLGNDREAAMHFRKALDLDPDDADAHLNLAHALRSLGRLEDAIVHYERTVELRPDTAAARQALERARAELGARR